MDASGSTNFGAKRKCDPSAYCSKKGGSANNICPKGRVVETEVFDEKVVTSSGKFIAQNYEYSAGTVAAYRRSEDPFYFVDPPPPEEVNRSWFDWKTSYSNFKNFFTSGKGSDSYYGRVPESTQHYFEKGETKVRKIHNSVQKRAKTLSLSDDPEINTLEDALNYFELQSHFCDLECSLEEVRRNKIKKEEHMKFFKSVDKAMQKKSIKFHPDSVRKNGGSDLQLEIAQKLQAALNTTRKVLNVLTEEFLKDTEIDYKYEYFLKLEISFLANETELSHRINEILFKICELSEIKRMNIVGEIRNFLVESKACIDSYFQCDRKEFKKKFTFALYHLRKCIEGYEKIEAECAILEKECGEEDEDNMKPTIVKLAKQSAKESAFLKQLESYAKYSLDGKFQFLPSYESMDSYFIFPFVYYINVILMCNIMSEKELKRSWFSTNSVSVIFMEEPPLIAYAYYLVSYFMGQKQYEKEVEYIIEKKNFEITKENLKEAFYNVLGKIATVLEERFNIDAYNKGKSNRMRFNERLSSVNEAMKNFQEKEKKLREQIRIYEKNNEENREKYHQFEQKNEEMERRARENLEHIKRDISKLYINRTENIRKSENESKSENQEKGRKDDHVAKEDSTESDRKFQKLLEENESMRKKVSEVLSKKNATENKNTFGPNEKENWSKSYLLKCNNDETDWEPLKSFDQIENKTDNLSELVLKRNQDETENKNPVADEKKDVQIMNEKIMQLEEQFKKKMEDCAKTVAELAELRSKQNKTNNE